jgi:HK97 family phage portal protein
MGLIQRILRGPSSETRGFKDVPAKVVNKGVASSHTSGTSGAHPGIKAGLDAFEINPWLFASVDLIARTAALVPWRAYRKKDKAVGPSKRERLMLDHKISRAMDSASLQRLDLVEFEHPALVVLNKPNPLQDCYSFFYTCWCLKELTGACYIYKSRDRDGKPNGLYPVPRTWIRHIATMDEPWFSINKTNSWFGVDAGIEIPERDFIVFKTPRPSDPHGEGVGLASVVGAEIDIDEFASSFLGSYFRNSAQPSLLIGVEDANETELERAAEKWNSANRGADNAHRVHFYSGNIDVKPISSSLKDAELIEVRKFERNTLIQVSSLPPECLGIIENSNRSTIDAADYHLRKNVIAPRLAAFWSVMQTQFMDEWPDLPGLLVPTSTIPEDLELKHKIMVSAPQAFTVNEWRAASGHPPISGGDTPYVATTYQSETNNADKTEQDKPPGGDKASDGSKGGASAADADDD